MKRVLAVASSSPVVSRGSKTDADLEALVEWMSGSFSSRQQSIEDPGSLDIRLHAVRIWTDRAGGAWLYAEQASAEALDRPYRQRIYRVGRRGDGRLESAVFEIPDPSVYVGAWREPERLENLAIADFRPREGCSVILERRSQSRFEGSVSGNACVSSLRDAAYATSQVVLEADVLQSWDCGFREDGMQVWGADDGPHVFRRVTAGTRR
jgi:hypothetical protein